jgi:hypothetical protein
MTPRRWLATLTVVLTACTPPLPTEKVPLTGNVTLMYAGPSASFEAAAFTLANGTSRSIYFSGIPDPREWGITCTNSHSAVGYGPGFIDPPPREEYIEVASGEGVRFDIYHVEADIKKSDGTCRLDLTLADGTVIQSPEFTP